MPGHGSADPDDRDIHTGARERADAPLQQFVATADGQALADRDQTLADADQTAADSDQTLSDTDQVGADVDQRASDADQDASDRDLAHGADRAAYERSREARRHTTHLREQTAHSRLTAAAQRDQVAHARDLAGLARDQAGIARDMAMAALDADDEHDGRSRAMTGAEIVLRASEQRRRAAEYRASAAEHRALAAQDRDAAAADREQAARDRLQALADRQALAAALQLAETDVLTGARTRAAGLRDLDHEIERARRTGGLLAVAYVDVVGLKALNDSAGHDAGDALLRRAVGAIRARLRPYDLVIRLGGDEFLCAMADTMLQDTRDRLHAIRTRLADAHQPCEIRVGFAELAPHDTAGDLIARADQDMLDSRS